jgi:hypothetical protein
MQDPNWSKKSQIMGEAATRITRRPRGKRGGRIRNPAYLRALSKAEMNLADTTSESGTSDPGRMPQLFRKSSEPDTRSRGAQQAASRRKRAAH